MLTIVIATVMFAIFCAIFIKYDRAFFGMIGAVCGVVIGIVIAQGITNFVAPKEWVKTHEVKLIAFNDSRSVHGRFFLGCGSMQERNVYLYYTQGSDGGIRQGWESTGNSVIYEQDRKDGMLEIYRTRLKQSWSLWGLSPDEISIEFYVPKGTVLRQFKADLE